ncbi:MAG TPA: hypothetical protein VLS25_10770 [Dehalococcoidia bacterium]|nr:hypothetical protein [Dehalococcoidia bacterium]
MLSAAKHLVAGRVERLSPESVAQAAAAILGLLVAALSFLPWMAYGYAGIMTSIPGNEMKGVTDLGDGWVTAIVGTAAALAAMSGLFWNLRGQLLASAIAICGLLIACIAGYDLINGVYVPKTSVVGFMVWFTFQERREPALWAMAAAGFAIAAAGFVLLAIANRRPIRSEPEPADVTEAWA